MANRPAARRKTKPTDAPPTDRTFLVIVAVLVVAAVLVYFGYPGLALVPVGLAVVGWIKPYPLLTGERKTRSGKTSTASGPREEKALRSFEFFHHLRSTLIGHPASLNPLAGSVKVWRWPWLCAVVIAVAVWALAPSNMTIPATEVIDAVAVFVSINALCSAARRVSCYSPVRGVNPAPGATTATLSSAWSQRKWWLLGATVAGAVVGAGIGWLVPGLVWQVWGITPRLPLVALVVVCALASAMVFVSVVLSSVANASHRALAARNEYWYGIYEQAQYLEPPTVVDTTTVGPFTVDTMRAPTSQADGSTHFIEKRSLIASPVSADGLMFTALDAPAEDRNGTPNPEASHPLKYRLVTVPDDATPDVSDASLDPAVAGLWLEMCFNEVSDEVGSGRWNLDEIEQIGAEGAAAVWASSWHTGDGAGFFVYHRDEMFAGLAARTGLDVRVDYVNGILFAAPDLDEAPTVNDEDPQNPCSQAAFERIGQEIQWNRWWKATGIEVSNPPAMEHAFTRSHKVRGNAQIQEQSFQALTGVSSGTYTTVKAETALKAAMGSAAWLSITHFAVPAGPRSTVRAGERHGQGITVAWCTSPNAIPSDPSLYRPATGDNGEGDAEADRLVMASVLDTGFNAAKLPRAQVYRAQCLTDPSKRRGHVWRIFARLYDGVTISEVRPMLTKMAQAVHAEFFEVDADVDEGLVFVVGAKPTHAAVAEGDVETEKYLTRVELSGAFYTVRISKAGHTPDLLEMSAMTKNPKVKIARCKLPPGMDISDVEAAKKKLAATTDHPFLEVRPAVSASEVEIITCRESPMPFPVGYDYEEIDELAPQLKIPFATGIDGESVVFDVSDNPHILLAGVTGAGKAQPLDTAVPTPSGTVALGDLAPGDELYSADGVTRLVAVTDVSMQTVHTLSFDDGSATRCSAGHLWPVSTQQGRERLELAAAADGGVSAQAQMLLGTADSLSGFEVAEASWVASAAGVEVGLVNTVMDPAAGVSLGASSFIPVAETLRLLADHLQLCHVLGEDPAVTAPARRVVSTTVLAQMGDEGFGVDPVCVGDPQQAVSAVSQALEQVQHRRHPRLPYTVVRSTDREAVGAVVDTVRAAGGWAASVSSREDYHATVFDLPQLDPTHQGRVRVLRSVSTGRQVPMRCLVVDAPSKTYVSEHSILTHNSVLAQVFLYAFAVANAELYVIDPSKGAADFQFLKPYAKAFATTVPQAAGLIRHIYSEVERRKDLNAKYGVGSYLELPDEVRPAPLVVMIDEFTSLMGTSQVPAKSDDVEAEKERNRVLEDNAFRNQVGMFTGKITREARSAGVVAALGTQKMSADMLSKIPGGGDIKEMLARVLLGKANWGARAAAFRQPENVPEVPDVVKGRGAYEPLVGDAVLVQSWFDKQPALAERLSQRLEPLGEDQLVDVDQWVSSEEREEREAAARAAAEAERDAADELVLDGLDLSVDDLDREVAFDTGKLDTDEDAEPTWGAMFSPQAVEEDEQAQEDAEQPSEDEDEQAQEDAEQPSEDEVSDDPEEAQEDAGGPSWDDLGFSAEDSDSEEGEQVESESQVETFELESEPEVETSSDTAEPEPEVETVFDTAGQEPETEDTQSEPEGETSTAVWVFNRPWDVVGLSELESIPSEATVVQIGSDTSSLDDHEVVELAEVEGAWPTGEALLEWLGDNPEVQQVHMHCLGAKSEPARDVLESLDALGIEVTLHQPKRRARYRARPQVELTDF